MIRKIVAGVFAAALLASAAAFAQRPPENVSPRKHPNLAAAQRLIEQAFTRISDAQRANEWDMSGHAEKAKKLLDDAGTELKLAAEAASHR